MRSSKTMVMICITILAVLATSSNSQTSPPSPPSPPLTPTPSPAPAPAPEPLNLTSLLSEAGPFSTFLGYLRSTNTLDTLQTRANNTDLGVTIFVPKDSAFSSQKNPSLQNLTESQLRQLILFHALPIYYSLSDFRALSLKNPVATMAGGGPYSLNFTDEMGTIRISSGWTRTVISSSVHASSPAAVYQVDKILLPIAIFGTDIPPMPAPAPAPASTPAADGPTADGGGNGKSPGKSPPGKSGASRVAMGGVISGAMVVLASLML